MSDELRLRCLRVIARARRRTRLVGAGRAACALAVLLIGCAPDAPPPPRVLLVTIDTLRADRVGAYGFKRARTPVLDALAAEGVRFDAAISPVPLTLPSHSTILTGLDPDRHGVRHNGVFKLSPEIPTLAERMRASGRATAAFVGAFVLDHRFGLARGFDVYDDQVGGRRSSKGVVSYPERRANEVVDAFLAWLPNAPDRFFAWMHVYDPHSEYDPPTAFSLASPHPYDGEIAFVDAQLGRLLEAIDQRFPREGMLVVVTSDHGDALGEHGEPTHSYSIYEATQRVPLIIAGPPVFRGGRVIPDVVRLADVAPTIAAAAGLEPLPDTDGRDLAGILGAGLPPLPAYSETLATHLDYGWSALFALRDARWRYIAAPEPELYDVAADPRERRNVVSEHADVAQERAAQIAERRARAAAPIAQQTLSADERERLAALGYVAGGTASDDLSGPDPKERIQALDQMNAADRLGSLGRWDEAYALLATSKETGSTFRSIRASFAVRAGRIDDAERDAQEGLVASPEHGGLIRVLGFARERRRDWAGAREQYLRALAIDPADIAAATSLGRVEEGAGDRAEAEKRYLAALEIQPGSAEATWRLAGLKIQSGDLRGGQALLAEAVPPTDAVTAVRVAALEADAGAGAEAAARLERVLDDLDLPAELTVPASNILERGGRIAAATRVHEEALRRRPDEWQFQNGVAWGLSQQGRDLDRALELAQSAVRGSKRDPIVLDTLASVQLARGDFDDARAVAGEALQHAPSELRSHLYYVKAAALVGAGRRDAARDAMRSAIAAGFPDGSIWLPAAQTLAGDLGADTSPPTSPP